MAYMQYLIFNGRSLPMPDSYELGLSDVEADSGGDCLYQADDADDGTES